MIIAVSPKIAEQYADGVRIGGYNEELSDEARTHAGRTMPV